MVGQDVEIYLDLHAIYMGFMIWIYINLHGFVQIYVDLHGLIYMVLKHQTWGQNIEVNTNTWLDDDQQKKGHCFGGRPKIDHVDKVGQKYHEIFVLGF